ncbi:predicted protein [Botrytis cinerea T4]|uniref:Uncharacterized protein n=1 Tax=Botryotinia fuckeliana (strain T4) TaxID=999810 RepID=G2Y8S7_BOTF4|nr:predicted protein [Botrytis cinerea T4]
MILCLRNTLLQASQKAFPARPKIAMRVFLHPPPATPATL